MKSFLLLFACLFLGGCAADKSSFSYQNPKNIPDTVFLLERAREIEKKDFENIQLETLAQNELSSHHLVVIRDREPLHYHATHDAWALVIKGKGEFFLGDKWTRFHPGVSFFIPRGVHHQAVSSGKEPLAAFAIFTPPYDGRDMVPVRENNPTE